VRDGQLDTRLAAERGVKAAYSVQGHSCEDDADDADPGKPIGDKPVSAKPVTDKPIPGNPASPFAPQNGTPQPK